MPFTKGNTLAVGRGRPKRGKNILPLIRDKVLQALEKRISGDKALKDVATEDLLKFAQSIMPKDISVKHSSDVQYISHTPRPAQCLIEEPSKTIEVLETITNETDTILKNNNENDNDNSIVSNLSIENDNVSNENVYDK